MSAKFKNKFRIESTRMRNWDYGWQAAYFVTVCTKNKQIFFGDITHDVMNLSPIGEIVLSEWLRTLQIRPDMNLKLGEYVVMPNHFHGIIIIGENEYNRRDTNPQPDARIPQCSRDDMHGVSTALWDTASHPGQPHGMSNPNDTNDTRQTDDSSQKSDRTNLTHGVPHDFSTHDQNDSEIDDPATIEKSPSKNKFGPQSKNLASIMRGFKSTVKTQARQINPEFAWQFRYHDHVIRNDGSFFRISEYIKNNPANWNDDIFHVL
ncbi:MAG TPA: hypothetical protein VFG10_09340 [Saprospiraceae bacterium]|nr:hypothetical protein [Saprospiraceae bacterium]